MIAHILNEDDNETGLSARQKLNAVIDEINDLASDYIAKSGTAGSGVLRNDFDISPILPTRFITDDSVIENGLLWYGSAVATFYSQKKADASYAGVSVSDGEKLDVIIQNYTTGKGTLCEFREGGIAIQTNSAGFSIDGDADYSPNALAFSFIQKCYVDDRFIPLAGTDPAKPVTDVISYLKQYGSAIASTDAFYIGTGDVTDLDNWSYGNRFLFEQPTAGQKSTFHLSGQYTTIDSRSGMARNGLTMNANGGSTFIQWLSNNGTHSSDLLINAAGSAELSSNDPAYQGINYSQDWSPNYTPLSLTQKTYVDAKDQEILDLATIAYFSSFLK